MILFNTQFVQELNANVSQESQTLNQEPVATQAPIMALQYLKNLKHPSAKPSNLESMLQVISRYMDESKALVSQVDTQFSEITQKQSRDVNFDITMQSFLVEYDGDERLQTNDSGERQGSKVSKNLAKSTISQAQKPRPKKPGQNLQKPGLTTKPTLLT